MVLCKSLEWSGEGAEELDSWIVHSGLTWSFGWAKDGGVLRRG